MVERRRPVRRGQGTPYICEAEFRRGEARTGYCPLHGRKIELDDLGVDGFGVGITAEHVLRTKKYLGSSSFVLGPARSREVIESERIRSEVSHRRAVLGSHICNRRPIGHLQRSRAGAVEFYEALHKIMLSQHSRQGQ